MSGIWQDIRIGVRSLRNSPGFTITAIITLALGIGANTAIFSVVDPLLLRKLPVQQPDELVLVHGAGSLSSEPFSEFSAYRIFGESHVLAGTLAYAPLVDLDIVKDGRSPSANAQFVTGSYFPMLGLVPYRGRLLGEEDDAGPHGGPVVVLSFHYWQHAYRADERVIGQALMIHNLPYTILGVTPPSFDGIEPDRPADLYLPIHSAPLLHREDPTLDSMWVTIFGRLKPHMSSEQAASELAPAFDEAKKLSSLPEIEVEQDMARLVVTPVAHGISESRERYAVPARILMAAVILILLIACANVAGLQLARGAFRRRELMVRLALGASRWRLAQQLLVEAAIIVLAGGAFALALGLWGNRLLAASLAGATPPVLVKSGLDGRVLWFASGVAVLGIVLSGLLPAVLATRSDVTCELKAQSASGQSHTRLRTAAAIVIVQVAFCVTLLAAATLLIHSLVNLERLDPGFDRDRVLAVRFDASGSSVTSSQVREAMRQLREEVMQLPGVESAALAGFPPVSGSVIGVNVAIEGRAPEPSLTSHAFFNAVTPDYFETMSIPLLYGRDFTEHDSPDSAAIINRTMARHYFGDENPIGRRFRFVEGNRPLREIVGVVADSKYNSVREEELDFFYIPGLLDKTLVVRAHTDSRSLIRPISQFVQSFNGKISITRIETLREQIDDSLHQDRFAAELSGIFGGLALALTCVGLFGLLSFSVARRTSEIGVRMALGAKPNDVFRLFVGNGVRLVVFGSLVGIAGAAAVALALREMVFGVEPADPVAIGASAALLLLGSVLASYVPAMKATRTDPIEALRRE